MRRGAGDFFRVEIERDFKLDVTDVGGAVARPFRIDMWRLKRAPPTSKRDGKRLAIAQLQRQLIEKSRLMHGRNVMNRGPATQSRRSNAGLRAPHPRQG